MAFRSSDDGMMAVKSVQERMEDEMEDVETKPCIVFDEQELPSITDWKVGSAYHLQIHVKQRKIEDRAGKILAHFEILGVKAI